MKKDKRSMVGRDIMEPTRDGLSDMFTKWARIQPLTTSDSELTNHSSLFLDSHTEESWNALEQGTLH
jgi:hypothetical protein